MRIYIIGISGMLGSKLFEEFLKNPNFIVRGSSRKIPNKFLKYKKYIDKKSDAFKIQTHLKNIKKFKPEVVINCIGIIKQKIKKKLEHKNIFYLNSIFPYELYKITSKCNSKLIHFSTDCVFDGMAGNYNESHPPNSKDLYGFSKMLGELNYKNSLTLRTSIIGHELRSKLSLVDWFLGQKKTCIGYSKAYFSGFPTVEIYKILLKILKRKKLYGIYHLSSQKISKYDLLKKIAKVYNKEIFIKKSSKIKINRSLNSRKLKKILNYKSLSWNKLILEMYKNYSKNH